MPWTRRRDRRGRPSRPEQRQITGPGALLGGVTLVLSAVGWWLTVRSGPSDALTLPFSLQLATFAGAAVVAVLWRWSAATGPTAGRGTATGGATGLARTVTRKGGGRSALPPRGLWLLPLAELVLFAPFLPVAFDNNPDDPTVAGLLPVYTLLLAWSAMLGALVAFFLVVLPALVVLRPLWLLARRIPLSAEHLLASVLGLMWLALVGTITGAVCGTPTRGGRGDVRQLGALLGLSEVTSPPWIWFGRASLVVLALGGVAAVALVRRVPRTPAGRDATTTAPPETP